MGRCAFVFGLCVVLLVSSAQTVFGDRAYRDPKLLYELDVKRAKDMVAAYSRLSSMIDRKHYIKVIFVSHPPGFTGGYELKACSAQGTLLTLKLVQLEDDDDFKGVSLRASEVLRLELLERPW